MIIFMNLGDGELKYCKVLFFILLIGKMGSTGVSLIAKRFLSVVYAIES